MEIIMATSKKSRERQRRQAAERDEANKRRFVDRTIEGEGIAAQDLPGAEHGKNVVDSPVEMQRNLPQQHGGELTDPDEGHSPGGMRGDRNISDAKRHGGRGKN
jgi:hypothetical protein